MTPRLVELEIEAFRGVAKALTLDLDAEAVLIRGDNGLGKTTVIDALSWLLCGELPHLAERVKGLRKGDDPIVNRYSEGPARVKLTVRQGEVIWHFERRGTTGGNLLAASRDDVAVEDPVTGLAGVFGHYNQSTFVTAVQTWGILRQDAVRAALEAGAALHERLARVVGLERVTTFADSAARVAKDLARERTRRQAELVAAQQVEAGTRAALNQLRQASAQTSQKTVLAALQRLQADLPEGIVLDPARLTDTLALTEVGRAVSSLVDAVARIIAAHDALAEQSTDQQETLDQASRALALAQSRLDEITQRAPLIAQLASSAMQLLGSTCPVCQQAIDVNTVQRHLQELLGNAQEDSRGEAQARAAVREAQQQLADAERSTARLRAAHAEAQDAAASLTRLLPDDGPLRLSASWFEPVVAPRLLEELTRLRDNLRSAYTLLPEAVQTRLAPAEVAQEAAAADATRLQLEVDELDGRCQRASNLDKAAHAAAERIVDSALARIGPSFAEVFDRLAPHPTFTVLRAKQDIFYGKNQVVPEVYDPERNLSANPLAVYSEGQLNVVALSYFLGLALNARDGALPFMLLDDPLQAMDVLSVLGFADLCRRIREQRQLIVTTHDRRFADLLARKLTPRDPLTRTVVLDFFGWTREGPEVGQSEVAHSMSEGWLRGA